MRCARAFEHCKIKTNAPCLVSALCLLPSAPHTQLTTIFLQTSHSLTQNHFALLLFALGVQMNFKHLEKWFIYGSFKFYFLQTHFLNVLQMTLFQTLFFGHFHLFWLWDELNGLRFSCFAGVGASGLRKKTRVQMKEFTMRKTTFPLFFTIKAKYFVFSCFFLKTQFWGKTHFRTLGDEIYWYWTLIMACWKLLDTLKHFFMKP